MRVPPHTGPSFLEQIVRAKQEELESLRWKVPLRELRARCRDVAPARPFLEAVRSPKRGETLRVVAEIKRASPSRGPLRPGLDPVDLAARYEEAGAAALSVLTERFFFQGSPEDLRAARSHTRLPVLRKDFTLGEYHVWEARALEADAVLLIVRLLDPILLRDLVALAHEELGMTALVEVHTEEEVARALEAGARLVGINNRDLATFTVDLETTRRLRGLLPPEVGVLSESGIRGPQEVAWLRDQGVDGLLIGEALVVAPDPGAALRELLAPCASG